MKLSLVLWLLCVILLLPSIISIIISSSSSSSNIIISSIVSNNSSSSSSSSSSSILTLTDIFIPVPLSNKVLQAACDTNMFYRSVLRTVSGMGMGMNVTAHYSEGRPISLLRLSLLRFLASLLRLSLLRFLASLLRFLFSLLRFSLKLSREFPTSLQFSQGQKAG